MKTNTTDVATTAQKFFAAYDAHDATLPDVLNAHAATSQAVFDLESADGDEQIARVTLEENLGVEPSPNILIDARKNAPLPDSLTLPIEELISRALADRPDLMAQLAQIREAGDEIRAAKAEYRPQIVLSGSAAQTAIWPTTDFGQLGPANEPTWSASLTIQWKIFDGALERTSWSSPSQDNEKRAMN
jgi:outer membrane protein TolC